MKTDTQIALCFVLLIVVATALILWFGRKKEQPRFQVVCYPIVRDVCRDELVYFPDGTLATHTRCLPAPGMHCDTYQVAY
jgi:hypothetical protein